MFKKTLIIIGLSLATNPFIVAGIFATVVIRKKIIKRTEEKDSD